MTRSVRRVAVLAAATVSVSALVLAAEVAYTLTRTYLSAASAPTVRARYQSPAHGATLRLVVLGDSTGAGVGASSTGTSVGGRLAERLAAAGVAGDLVLRSEAESGARAGDLAGQVDRARSHRPDVVLVLVGANDATHLGSTGDVAQDLGRAVRRLRAMGARVVVGTCPDLGAARNFPQPLRALVGWRGQAVADVEIEATRAAGGVAVDLAERTGPAFRSDARALSTDRFHPSDLGYRLWADALWPAVHEAAAAAVAEPVGRESGDISR